MSDKKFTDEEIIRNYEWCIGCTSDRCRECTIDEQVFCEEELQDLVLDLINRQKSEIEKLNIQLQGLWNMASLYKAESERWEGYNENLLTANSVLSNEILEAKAKAKAEAYKEFARRAAIALTAAYRPDYAFWILITLDNLLKEMVGEEE